MREAMVDRCANPQCLKPLRYLREGRIFVFDVPDNPPVKRADGVRPRRMEHYWLCGSCASAMVLKHSTEEGVRLLARSPIRSSRVRLAPNVFVSGRLAS